MKKLKTLILVIPVLLLAVSCGDDFTILAPHSDRNVENFYRTDSDFIVAINGAYAALAHNDAYGRNYALFHEMRSDNTSNGGGNTGLAETLYRLEIFNELASATELETTWAGAYRGIARTNVILARVDDMEFNTSGLGDRIKGEALFIRSLLYYNLAVIFGNIPLQLDEVSGPSVEINQVSASVIYDQIAGDLEEAENLLPLGSTLTGENLGRASKGAAATLLGLVHLTNGNDALAEAALRRVIDSEEYDLVPNYADIFGITNEHNIESIFEIQYKSGGTGTGSSYTEFYTPFGTSGGVGGGNAPQVITSDVLSIYEDDDERFWGGTFDSVLVDTADTDFTYFVKKYESTPFDAFDADNNFIVFRYADVLLMLAEAIGESGEANGLINDVRGRAGLTEPVENLPGTFEEKLLNERRREFAIEFKRWPDLRRFGVAKQVMVDHFDNPNITESDIRLLYPIPQRELDSAPGAMEQNSL
ncbi:MAG: RagB/SusD family nutrient uptake outer membrane protein [Balneolaceae bacterium]